MAEPSITTAPPTSYEEPFAYGQDARHESFEEEDKRWHQQWKDWILLTLMILVSLTYHLLIFYFQPGLGS